MKKLTLLAILVSSVALSPFASANTHTVTLGYAQSKVQDFDNIRGANLKYRYEWDSALSVISSFTWMSGSFDDTYLADKDRIKNEAKITYYSLAVGPAYRLTEYLSFYGLIGLNHSKAKAHSRWSNYESGSYRDMETTDYSGSKTTLMYGAGLQINPAKNWVIDMGYEGSSYDDGIKNRSIHGFNIGAGLSF